MNGKSLNGCSLLIPKAILDEIGGFNTEYVYILDWIYWIEIAMKGHAFFEYPEVLVKNRKHKEQVSVKKKEQLGLETNEFILELIDKAIDNRERSIVIWNYCKRIGLKKGCKKISDVYKIPFGNLMKGNVCRLERVARSLFRKFIYRFTR